MPTQADVDAITTEVGNIAAELDSDTAKLQTEIDALSAANPSLDLTALQAAVTPLDAKAQALGALVPTPPAP